MGVRRRGRSDRADGPRVRAREPGRRTSACSRFRGPRRTRSCSPRSSAARCPTSRSWATRGFPSSPRSAHSQPLDSALARDSAHMPRADYFPGVLATNVVDDTLFGVPWYVDTRVLFYRTDLLRAAGVASPPTTWAAVARRAGAPEARAAAGRLSRPAAARRMGAAGDLSRCRAAHRSSPITARAGTFAIRAFVAASSSTSICSATASRRRSPTPRSATSTRSSPPVASRCGSPARGTSASFAKRLPDSLQSTLATAPLPGPDGPGVSLAGGSSLVIMRKTRHRGRSLAVHHVPQRPRAPGGVLRRHRRPAGAAARRGRLRRSPTIRSSRRFASSSGASCRCRPCRSGS